MIPGPIGNQQLVISLHPSSIHSFPRTLTGCRVAPPSAEAEQCQRPRSQFAALKRGQNIKYRPHAFTEPGALRAANRFDTALCLTD